MNAKVRWVIDLSGIYIKEKAASRKIFAHVPVEFSTVGSISCHRTWGIGSRKKFNEDMSHMPKRQEHVLGS